MLTNLRLFLVSLLCLWAFGAPLADDHLRDREELMEAAKRPMTGDLEEMIARRMVRMAIPYNPIYFSYDGEKMIGLAVEIAREFETFLSETHGVKVDVILMPLGRDQILPALLEGRVDIAAANLTITPEREEIAAFSIPTISNVAELVVTGPAAGRVSSFEDLVDTGVYLRPSSSYYSHMMRLNTEREIAGKDAIPVIEAEENLEDYDLLDLLHAGSIPAVVVDSHKLELWEQVFDNITIHENLVLNEGGEIAWAMRKDATRLLETANIFLSEVREGTLVGNVLLERYLGDAQWIENIRSGVPLEDYHKVVEIMKRYAAQYDFDWEILVAQAYQESKLDQSQRSEAGAIGVMQVLESTAADPNIAIEGVDEMEPNIHAGVKYMRFLRDRYFSSPEIERFDEVLFSLAAYNAGPANIRRARRKAEELGLDPDRWLKNVEIAAAQIISQEPVIYVRNIYKYSISLGLLGGYEVTAEVNDVAPNPRPDDQAPVLFLSTLAILTALGGLAFFFVMRKRS